MYKNYLSKQDVSEAALIEQKKRDEQDELFKNNFENKISCFDELNINEEEFLTMNSLFEIENTNKCPLFDKNNFSDTSIQKYDFLSSCDSFNKIIINDEVISGIKSDEISNVVFYYKSKKNNSCFIKNISKNPKIPFDTTFIKKFIDIINEKYYKFLSLNEENKKLKNAFMYTKNKKINELTNSTLSKIIIKNNVKILMIQMFFMNLNHIIYVHKLNEFYYLYNALNDIYFSQICHLKTHTILNFLKVNLDEFLTEYFNMPFEDFKNMFLSLTNFIDVNIENNKIMYNEKITSPDKIQYSNCKKYFEEIQNKLDEKQKDVNEYVNEFNDFTRHRLTINMIYTLKISETPECSELLEEYQKYDNVLNDKIYHFNNIINSLKHKCSSPCFEFYFSKYLSAITYGSLTNNNVIDSTINKTIHYDLLKSNYKNTKLTKDENIKPCYYKVSDLSFQTDLMPVKKSYDIRGDPLKETNPSNIEVKKVNFSPWANSTVKV